MAMKFRAHDTFFIRKGWLSKGMKYVQKKPDVFVAKDENPTMSLSMSFIISIWISDTAIQKR